MQAMGSIRGILGLISKHHRLVAVQEWNDLVILVSIVLDLAARRQTQGALALNQVELADSPTVDYFVKEKGT
jgi:hypothetical protein